MKIDKLKILHKIYKEDLDQTVNELNLQYQLLEKHEYNKELLLISKKKEIELADNNFDLKIYISNFLKQINQKIDNINIAIINANKNIENTKEKIQEIFISIKQIEHIIKSEQQKLKNIEDKIEQQSIDELSFMIQHDGI